MLFSIDQDKIKEQLAASPLQYGVTASNLETPNMRSPDEIPSSHVYSTIPGLSPDLERAKERLLTLRQRVIEDGLRPLPPAELEREIDETRGRS